MDESRGAEGKQGLNRLKALNKLNGYLTHLADLTSWFRRLNGLMIFCSFATLLLCGCAGPRPPASARPFVFHEDSFAFSNQLVWRYYTDPATGKTAHMNAETPPTYSRHCFVVVRSARQFFQFARFDPRQPVADEASCRRMVQHVISLDPRRDLSPEKKIVIPGYANLYAFSQAHEALLKDECGGAWQSYFQRGHWRMIFPFTPHHQQRAAEQLLKALKQNVPPLVHVVRFPQLSINHAILLFAAQATEKQIQFSAYDPNNPAAAIQLIFDRARRRFIFPATDYFPGGRVAVYQIYCAWDY